MLLSPELDDELDEDEVEDDELDEEELEDDELDEDELEDDVFEGGGDTCAAPLLPPRPQPETKLTIVK